MQLLEKEFGVIEPSVCQDLFKHVWALRQPVQQRSNPAGVVLIPDTHVPGLQQPMELVQVNVANPRPGVDFKQCFPDVEDEWAVPRLKPRWVARRRCPVRWEVSLLVRTQECYALRDVSQGELSLYFRAKALFRLRPGKHSCPDHHREYRQCLQWPTQR